MHPVVTYRPIGLICSEKRDPNATVIPGPATLRLEVEESALKGLEEFSHVWLIFHFHGVGEKGFEPEKFPALPSGERLGVFATRSPCRANPIGLTCARLERVENGTLHLSDVDLVDQTPILDIKPYVPTLDRPDDPMSGWFGRMNALYEKAFRALVE